MTWSKEEALWYPLSFVVNTLAIRLPEQKTGHKQYSKTVVPVPVPVESTGSQMQMSPAMKTIPVPVSVPKTVKIK